MTRSRRGLVPILAGVVLLTAPLWPSAAGAEDAELVGFTFTADSDAVTQTGGDPSSQGYPQAQSRSGHTEARLDTGPNGYALASSEWPGGFLGNVGSLAQVFGAPEEAGAANYPVRAEAQSSGPTSVEQAGASAKAEGGDALALVDVDGYDGGGSTAFSFGDVHTESRTTLDVTRGIAKATAVVSDISFGDGTIQIDSVTTVAEAATDGRTGTSSGSTLVSGATVAGRPVRIDESGVRAGDSTSPNPADAIAQALTDQVLTHFEEGVKVTMFVTKPRSRSEGNVQEYQSGSLVVLMELGDPSAGSGGTGAFVIGGSNAFVLATPGIALTAATPSDAAPSSGIFTPLPSDATGGQAVPSPSEAPVAVPVPSTPDEIATTSPITALSRFAGLPFIMPFFVLLGSLLAGRGLHQLHEVVVAGSAGACPLRNEVT